MNGRQKEVFERSLQDEQAVLDALTKNYTAALADVKRNIRELQANPLTQSKAYQLEYQKQLEKQISGVIDNLQGKNYSSVANYLQESYTNGFVGNMYDLQGQGVPLVIPIDERQVLKAVEKTGDDFKLANKLGVPTKELKKQVKEELQRGLATQLSYAEIARNISDYGLANMHRTMNIARTEGHRVQNEARMDSMFAAKEKGADIVKQWDSTLDGNTRPEHQELDGQIRELDEDFTVGSYSAPCPGAFGDPYMDCNCRCAMLQRARWALDKDELDTLKERAEFFGLDKTESFEEFKEKYLTINQNNDIIKSYKSDNDFSIGRSVGAKAMNYDVLDPGTGEFFNFVEGSRIQNSEVFAGKGTSHPLKEDVALGLSEQIGGKPENWQHVKGIGTLDYYGEERVAEVHWFQEKTVGRHKFKVKRWVD